MFAWRGVFRTCVFFFLFPYAGTVKDCLNCLDFYLKAPFLSVCLNCQAGLVTLRRALELGGITFIIFNPCSSQSYYVSSFLFAGSIFVEKGLVR